MMVTIIIIIMISFRPPPLPLSSFGNSIFLEQLNVIRDTGEPGGGRSRGVELEIVLRASVDRTNMPTKKTLKRTILFGDSVSDVVSAIGSPSKVFFKVGVCLWINCQFC